MVQINETQKKTKEELAELYWGILVKELKIKNLPIKLKDRNEPRYQPLIDWLQEDENNLKQLVIGDPIFLNSLCERFGPMNKLKKLREIFDYERFRETHAFHFYSEHLDLKICPYCNRNYLDIRKNERSGKLAFHLDHFFDRASYPYLSLSFFNLIPSCAVCNSMGKGTQTFDTKSHLHPWIENFHKSVRFILEPIVIGEGKPLSWNVELAPRKGIEENVWMKAYRLAVALHLGDYYKRNVGLIEEMILKREMYPDSYFEVMYHENTGIFRNAAHVRESLLGVAPTEAEIAYRPLGKLIYDLHAQLWEETAP